MGPSSASRKSDLVRFYVAHHGSYVAAASDVTNWKTYLRGLTSSSSTNIAELEMAWLAGLGFSTGTLADRWGAYTKSLGYTGGAPERIRAYWAQW